MYRSHADLLKVPSSLFYADELIPSVSKDRGNAFLGANFLPNKNVPLVIVNVAHGQELRQTNGTSWYNPAEILQVIKYTQLVQKHLGIDILQKNNENSEADELKADEMIEDIGIIAPYRQQIRKLREYMNQLHMKRCRVGTVEEFQGQERKAIILSTVRSKTSEGGSDGENIGFLHSEKRFNVAITRAQSLLVVVTNVESLKVVPCWRRLFEFARSKGCIVNWK